MNDPGHPKVTLVATVLNEAQTVRSWMESLLAQTRCPDEVIVVDGGSADGTVALLQEYAGRMPLKVLVAPGASISQGRNRAIVAAAGPLIAVTDAGVRLEPDWLKNLLVPFGQDPAAVAVAGFFHADPNLRSPFEAAMSATVLPMLDEIDPARFLPSSRSVAFRKSAWEAVGGYPEWLDYCEDLVFDIRLRELVGRFAWAPNAVVRFKPRSNLRSYFLQYYRYARGDGKADLWRKRHAIRYITYVLLAPAIGLLGYRYGILYWALLLPGAAVYLRRPYRRLARLWGQLSAIGKAQSVLWVVFIRVIGDLAKMIGYPVGWRWRLRQRPPAWKPPRT
jgi:glycosyltransferase involved in cell wall biosynthesis